MTTTRRAFNDPGERAVWDLIGHALTECEALSLIAHLRVLRAVEHAIHRRLAEHGRR